MIKIIKAGIEHSAILGKISKQSFQDSHGESASKNDIDNYISQNFSPEILKQELEKDYIDYRIIYFNNTVAGYSKILLNEEITTLEEKAVTKLSRLYLLKEFYGKGLGSPLIKFNIQLSKDKNQKGMWLFVWKENQNAIRFYTKNGFKIVGSYDFKISETHSNPNHIMLLEY